MNTKKVRDDALTTMWEFLRMGAQKPNIGALEENCATLQTMMEQKTAGQRKDKPKDVSFSELEAVTNAIVIEAMCLWLSGSLEKLKEVADE